MLSRRSWLSSALAALGGLFVVRKATAKQKRVESHYFDWTDFPPHTTDPRHAGTLTWGEHQMILCDGEDVSSRSLRKTKGFHGVTRCVAGPNGWVEIVLCDREGVVLIDHERSELRKTILHGNVEYIKLRESDVDRTSVPQIGNDVETDSKKLREQIEELYIGVPTDYAGDYHITH